MPIRAVLFDLDDTLLDTHGCSQLALAATCAVAMERYPGLGEERVREAYYAVIREVDRQLGVGELSLGTARELDEYRWLQILARCGAGGDYAPVLAEQYGRSRRAHYRLYPEVPGMLAALPASFRLGVLTNGPGELQREKIAAVTLERWVAAVTISGELGVWKPKAEIFLHALAQLGCAPEEGVMVGDSLHNDIAGAAAVGLRTVWVNRYGFAPLPETAPDAEVEDLGSLPELLARWG